MNKKYELTSETVNLNGHILCRIKALRDFSNVKAGDLGGYIESEYNLSHYGNCWIYNGRVYQNSRISGDARVCRHVRIYGDIQICGDAWICLGNYTHIRGDIKIDHGIWAQSIAIDNKFYLLSSTLEKILVW